MDKVREVSGNEGSDDSENGRAHAEDDESPRPSKGAKRGFPHCDHLKGNNYQKETIGAVQVIWQNSGVNFEQSQTKEEPEYSEEDQNGDFQGKINFFLHSCMPLFALTMFGVEKFDLA